MAAPTADFRTYAIAAPKSIVIGTILLAGATILLGGALATDDTPTRAVVWGSVALAVYAAAGIFLTAALERSGDLGLARWKIGPWALVWCGATSGLATVVWSRPQTGTAAQISVDSVLRALWLVAVGMTCWMIGYIIGPGHTLQRLASGPISALASRRSKTVRSRLTPWLLYGIGATARVGMAITTGRFGYVGNPATSSTAAGYQQILVYLSLLCPLALCAAALQVCRERLPGARITLGILFVIEAAFGAAGGGKGSFITAALAAAIPMSGARYRLPKRLLIGGAVAFMLIIIPFNQTYRDAVRGGPTLLTTSQAINGAPALLQQALTTQGGLLDILPSSADYLLQRLQEIEGPAIILQRSPGQVPFASPVQLIEGPIEDMVPRAIWPGKPILTPGYQFAQEYYNLPASYYTAMAVSPVGDLYRHGGWGPVIIGMLVFGCGLRLLDDALDIRENPHAIFLVLLLLPPLIEAESDWVTLLASIPATVLTGFFAIIFTFRPHRST